MEMKDRMQHVIDGMAVLALEDIRLLTIQAKADLGIIEEAHQKKDAAAFHQSGVRLMNRHYELIEQMRRDSLRRLQENYLLRSLFG